MPGICAAERRFSLAKRKCGIGLVTAKLRETAAHVIAMSVLVLNLRKIQCAILQLLAFCRYFSQNCVYMYGVVPSFSHRLQYSVHNNVKFTPGRANSL